MNNPSGIFAAALLATAGITFAIAPAQAQAPADNAKIAQMQGAERQ